jgi:hypothetical protein
VGYYDPSAPQYAYMPQQPGVNEPPPKYEDVNPKKNNWKVSSTILYRMIIVPAHQNFIEYVAYYLHLFNCERPLDDLKELVWFIVMKF